MLTGRGWRVRVIGGIEMVWSLHLPASLLEGSRWMLGNLGWDFLLFSYPLSELAVFSGIKLFFDCPFNACSLPRHRPFIARQV